MMEFLKELPIDELDCYRKVSAWGMEDTFKGHVWFTGTYRLLIFTDLLYRNKTSNNLCVVA